jgi:hypothetical protein
MWKPISGVIVSVCLASNQAMAIDATWQRSTIFEGPKEPTILKFDVFPQSSEARSYRAARLLKS